MPLRFGAASISRRMKPLSKSRAMPKPVKTPENAADCSRTNTNWKAVYPSGKSNPGTCRIRANPPTNAVKKKSGNSSDGNRKDGFVKNVCACRHATALATSNTSFTSAPALNHERPHRFDQVRDGIDGRDPAEPGRRDQLTRDVHGRQEQEHEEDREQALDSFRRTGAQRGPAPERREGERDHGLEQEQQRGACNSRFETHAERDGDREIEDRLHERDRQQASELADEQHEPAHGREREAVEEAGLDVSRKLDVRIHGGEERALHERYGKPEREE